MIQAKICENMLRVMKQVSKYQASIIVAQAAIED